MAIERVAPLLWVQLYRVIYAVSRFAAINGVANMEVCDVLHCLPSC